MVSEKPVIVIIGASFAGIPLAHSLLEDVHSCKVILINPSPTFYYTVAAPRIVAKPTAFHTEDYLISIRSAFEQYPPDSFDFAEDRVCSIELDRHSVTLDNGGIIPFDYFVIASGSTTQSTFREDVPIPFKKSNLDNMEVLIKNAQDAISSASSIVIGGAGPIGVELASEIAEAAEQRGKPVDITIVSASDRALPMLNESASRSAESLLEQKKVRLIKSRKVTSASTSNGNKIWNITLDSGDQITADLYIPTTGVVPNNGFIPREWLDDDGWVKVDNELRVLFNDNEQHPIYAAGDITNNSMRLAFKAAEQATVVAANIKHDIIGRNSKTKRRVYDQGQSVMMIVPVGASGGTGQLFGITLWSFMVKYLKSNDFFISKARSMIGAS
jgi:NADH dehydrogenase FAD-containing subunit